MIRSARKAPLAEPVWSGKELRRQNRALADGHGPFDDERSKVRFMFVDGLRFEYNKGAEPVPAGASAPRTYFPTRQLDFA